MKLFKKKTKIKTDIVARSQQAINRNSYIIHHYCPHTYNIGDHFVIRSIRKYLKMFLPEATFVPKACANNRGWGKPTKLVGPNINLSNEYADAILIGGSDQYNNWSLRISEDEVRKLIPPLYLIGLGVSSKSIDEKPYIKEKKYYQDILATNLKAQMSSVRDNITHDFLQSIGYNKSVVTGCPATYLFNEEFHLQKNGVVALTFPFPVIKNINAALYNDLVDKIKGILEFIKQRGYKPVITCHDDRDVFVAQRFFPEEVIFYSNYVDEFIDFYKNTSFVIGSRLHASIFVSGLGKPFININIDKRGIGFSETFGLSDWNINIDDEKFLDLLKQRVETIISEDLDVFNTFFKTKSKLRTVFLGFMENVAVDIQKNSIR